jgi:uncharacterized protein
MHRLDLRQLTGGARPVIGMIHLQPLPGSPRFGPGAAGAGMARILDAALRDASALASGGVDAVMVENFGDAPFFPDRVPPVTVAAMARCVAAVVEESGLPVGVNVLRNDANAAIAIAVAAGARFIRVNVHTGAMLTDQGWIGGRAHDTLRLRASLAPDVGILADVLVKHAVEPAGLDIADAARDTWHRGLADALIVSGAATGEPTDAARLQGVRAALPHAPLLVGSGMTPDNAAALFGLCDGAIVGSAFQQDGRAGNPVEAGRVRRLMDVIGALQR